jgi:DNA-binding transcriptional MocR family regulator
MVTLTPVALSQLLGPWMHGKGPLRVRLKGAVEKAILDGLIADGTRLPSERGFADAGGVSRSTIVSAYDLLEDDGLLERRRGSGTIVRTAAARSRMTSRRDAELTALSSGMILQEPDDIVDLTLGWPDLPNEFLPYFNDLTLAELHGTQCRSIYASAGLPPLRERIAARYAKAGIPTTAENIIVTTGSQQGLSLAAWLFVRAGETVAIEQPTFFVALDAFRALGARLRAFAPGFVDPSLKQEMASSSFRALYCIPTFQNPTGRVMPEPARRNLVSLAREQSIPVLEDCALEALTFGAPTPRSLAYFDSENVVSLGSLNKIFWPGLRVGWIRASQSTVARLSRLKVMSDFGTSVPSQVVAIRVLESFDSIAAFRRREFTRNCDLLCQRLAEQLPDWQFEKPGGGLFLWVRLPFGDATSFAQFAARAGVRILPGSSMAVDGSCTEYVQLPFTACRARIEAGVARLASAWRRYAHTRFLRAGTSAGAEDVLDDEAIEGLRSGWGSVTDVQGVAVSKQLVETHG